ncbi:DNA primase [Microlunatus parietis]|uniref:DNA primase n=1 Tax=Microlunatus parietis TaxID=682979 RepID=A0A7Y9L7T8_9ACTN|nr:DNA primase [Microlunatus parietis]NYE70094.1 DNA primase [Microlunatus parietis]
MAGRINEEDIAAVRERARIDEIVGSYVTLRRSGSAMVGLCPFHEEKTPSFQVTPSRGLWYCFGACSEGGDVISFVQKIDNLTFVEAIERLADRVGIQLRYSDDGGTRTPPGLRMRLMESHQAAAEFYAEQLAAPDALQARQFLAERGFDRDTALDFGVGFAPRDGRALLRHLRGRGFADADLVAGGLARESGYDFFQGRLLWPIRDSGRQVLGFGGRRIFDDDRISAKYINTPETPLYKKSHVLYGLDRARQAIAKKSQAVVVEGYTDVMAAHLSGVDTAIASCGTAFGDDHARLLRRLMGDHDAFGGEVIFTFDGDEAGQSAALKVFSGDQNFLAQTYVAVEPSGLDPCDLRLQQGEAAVRELVARRVPLYRFVMSNIVGRYDLDRVDGRLNALRAAAPLVGSIRDRGLVSGYVRELTGLLGMEPEEVQREVARAARAPRPQSGSGQRGDRYRQQAPDEHPPEESEQPPRRKGLELPDPNDRLLTTERQTLKLIIQAPQRFGAGWDGITAADFTHPAYAAVFTCVEKAAADGAEGDWAHRVSLAAEADRLRSLTVSLAVEPLPITGEPTERLVAAYSSGLQLLTVMRQIAELKSKLQRTNPVDQAVKYNQMFSELVVLEARRHALHQRSIGAQE